MNKHAKIRIHGNAGTGVAENMMSGLVHVMGDASQSAGATGLRRAPDHRRRRRRALRHFVKGIDILVKGSMAP